LIYFIDNIKKESKNDKDKRKLLKSENTKLKCELDLISNFIKVCKNDLVISNEKSTIKIDMLNTEIDSYKSECFHLDSELQYFKSEVIN